MRPICLALPMLIVLAACKVSDGAPPDANATQSPAAPVAQYQATPATRVVTIPDDFAAGPFVKIPKNPE